MSPQGKNREEEARDQAGASARASRPADEILAACRESGTAPFVKQLGAKPRISARELASTCAIPVECEHGYDVCPTCNQGDVDLPVTDRKGGDMSEWPARLRVREFPGARA